MPKITYNKIRNQFSWPLFWMRFAGLSAFGRLAMRVAAWSVRPYKGRILLSEMSRNGFIESSAIVSHPDLHLGDHCFMGDRVVIFNRKAGGAVRLGSHVQIYRDSILETGRGGSITLDDYSSIHAGCHLCAYLAPIRIGAGVMLAPNCTLYSFNHGIAPNEPIRKQPLTTRGGIVIGAEAWLGFGVGVLSGTTIGNGAVIGAGSLVVHNVPDNAIAVGNPARIVGMRTDIDLRKKQHNKGDILS